MLLVLAACTASRPTPDTQKAWEYHYDRNALVASELAGDSIVALTKAGHLLRFDRRTFELTGEKIERRSALALGTASDGSVVVGFATGYVGKLDSTTLETTTIGSVPGHPYWIGHCAGIDGLVVAYRFGGAQRFGERDSAPYSVNVRLLATGQEVRVHGGALHCDRQGRLWAGHDRGEWGGSVEVVDLHSSTLEAKPIRLGPRGWDGVYGFIDADDGTTLAYGGTSHMGFYRAFVARVSNVGPAALVYTFEGGGWRDDPPEPGKAFGPIDHIVRTPDTFIVFALGRVYECDSTFARWERIAVQGTRTTRGRPDAVGSYPSLIDVRRSEDGPLLLTTRLDGLVKMEGEEKRSHALANEPDSITVDSITAWRSGLAAFDRDDEPIGSLIEGRWRSPFAGLPEVAKKGRYLSAAYLPRDNGRVLVVAAWSSDPDLSPSSVTLVTAELGGDRLEVLGSQPAGDMRRFRASSKAFLLPDGSPAVQAVDDSVWTLDGARWTQVAKVDSPHIVKTITSRWVIVRETWEKRVLARVDPPFQMTPVPVKVDGRDATVEDAISLDDDHLIVATDPVLCTLDVRSGNCEILRTGATDEARRLARDAHGRIWIAGRGLWRLDEHRRAIRYPLQLPFLRDAEIGDLEVAGDRLALAMGEHGLALLDSDAKPDSEPAPPEPPLQDFEPRYADGAVILACTAPKSEGRDEEEKEFEKQFDRLHEDVWNVLRRPREAGAQEKSRVHWHELVFHTPDPDALALRVAAVAKASPLAPRLRVLKRSGPRGYTPLADVYAGALAAPYEP